IRLKFGIFCNVNDETPTKYSISLGKSSRFLMSDNSKVDKYFNFPNSGGNMGKFVFIN
ncbi:unnamed protein product, partial [Rotaria sp. Silwood1]